MVNENEENKTPSFEGTVLFVEDVEKSKNFYVEILGQKIKQDYGRFVGFEGGFGIWKKDFAFQTIFSHVDEETEQTFKHAEVYFEFENLLSQTYWYSKLYIGK